ncbi:MAG TPA: restriction endonuclease [Clostridium sp.]|nr:restriction endonuclease [Clostridium sp.]
MSDESDVQYDDLTEVNSNYYSENYTNFEEWFNLVKNKQDVYPFCKIPYIDWFNMYIETIEELTIESVKDLLRCLLWPFIRKIDTDKFNIMYSIISAENYKYIDDNSKKYIQKIKDNESLNRMQAEFYAWEGLTWVVGLLPNDPYKAIEALKLYLKSEVAILPDDRIIGIEQCIQIILAKFIQFERPVQELLKLKPREFERLINELYKNMGYKTILTKATRDGGKDIIADIDKVDGNERLYIECKLYNKSKLTRRDVGYFVNTILNDKVNRGVIFCTGYVSEKVKDYDRRVQILTYEEINILLNAYLGLNWVDNIKNIVRKK